MQSCGPRLSSEAYELLSGSQEPPECLKSFTYTSPLTVNAVARFYKRDTDIIVLNNKITNMILTDPLNTPLPIPYAEVAVYDQNKNLVQCGVTDFNGNLQGLNNSPLTIPAKAESYIIHVYARTRYTMPNKGFKAIASVKENIYSQKVHRIETTFSTDGYNISPIILTAYARQTDDLEIRGGAFNIYNNFIQAYTFLDNDLNLIASNDLQCLSTPFNIYWKAGFNPYQYVYPQADPSTIPDNSSYYDKNTKSLFITGGQVGDVSLANTDHFDDFATIHEMGHFIEHQCGRLTKGGSHQLIVRIDQRLAWHEAWANYFAALVMNKRLQFLNPQLNNKFLNNVNNTGDLAWSYLYNSVGFSDSFQNIGNGTGFLMDFKKPGTAPGEWQIGSYYGLPFDQINSSLYPGEGHTREGAISRGLFKMSVSSTTLCTSCGTAVFPANPLNFNYIWYSMNSITGFSSINQPFIGSNLFLETLKTTVGNGFWNTYLKPVVNSEALQVFSDNHLSSTDKKYVSTIGGTDYLNWIPFGHKLLVNNACANLTSIQPRNDDPTFTGGNSDQRYSNHFYTLDPLTLIGLDSITVSFTKDNGTNTDFDLLIFNDGYHFNEDYSCSGSLNSYGTCSNNTYIATRNISSHVAAYNRNTSPTLSGTYTKTINNLSVRLDPTKKYILNIRAYTAGKGISTATSYIYSINSNLGTLCPQ